MGIISTHQADPIDQIQPTMNWTAFIAILALIINIMATIVSMLIQ